MKIVYILSALAAVFAVSVMIGQRSGFFKLLFWAWKSYDVEQHEDLELFQAFDVNNDGYLSPDEFRSVAKHIARQHVSNWAFTLYFRFFSRIIVLCFTK